MAAGWRLLVDGAASGPWNMGVDEALLASAVGGGRPTLRLYHWSGAWLSLGYRQQLVAERRSACEAAGVGFVRRVTGGRAVLHGGDLTYAIAAREEALPLGLRATYALVGAALHAALLDLGIDALVAPAAASGSAVDAFDCFAETAGDELCVAGRKLVGSAQRRARAGVLQHGSIRLAPDPPQIRAAAGLAVAAATSLAELGFVHSAQRVARACVTAFSRLLETEFEVAGLEPEERRIARERVEAHAGNPLAVPVSSLGGNSKSPHANPQERLSPTDR